MMRRRILIVDDDAFIRRPLEMLLRKAGFETEAAVDGEACLESMARQCPDLVCLDVMMPIRDGLSTLEEIQRSPNLRGTPVILLTARGQENDMKRGLALGAVEYVQKPYSPAGLLARIQAALDSAEACKGGRL